MKVAEEEEDEGLLFVGDRGKILCDFHGGHPPTHPGIQNEQLQAATKNTAALAGERTGMAGCLQGEQVKPGGNFEFSGLVTETLLLGNVRITHGAKNSIGIVRISRCRTRSRTEVRVSGAPQRWEL